MEWIMFEVKVTYGREIFNVELDGLTCNSVEDVLEAVVDSNGHFGSSLKIWIWII